MPSIQHWFLLWCICVNCCFTVSHKLFVLASDLVVVSFFSFSPPPAHQLTHSICIIPESTLLDILIEFKGHRLFLVTQLTIWVFNYTPPMQVFNILKSFYRWKKTWRAMWRTSSMQRHIKCRCLWQNKDMHMWSGICESSGRMS